MLFRSPKGEDGKDAPTEITVNEDGYIVVNGVVTEYKANPEKSGCNGSIGVGGIALTAAGLLAAGVAVHALKKRKQN